MWRENRRRMTAKRSHSSGRESAFPEIDFLFSLRPSSMKLGLENITKLLDLVGNPQLEIPAILVAGTNGKGSVTAFLSSVLRASGLRTGTFYSPHLFRINERIGIGGEEIPSPDLDRLIGLLRSKRGKAPFTFFEGIMASAALYFREKGVDVAVYEVGLGGRLDATRLAKAEVTVITGISIDHKEHLGSTKARILTEKLGITREGAALVANLGTKALNDRAARHCRAMGIPFHSVRDSVRTEIESIGPGGMSLRLETPVRDYGRVTTRMIGAAAAANAATAVRAAEVFLGGARKPGKPSVRKGLGGAFLAGRFQVLSGNPRIVLDVSHNEEALLASLKTLLEISPRERNIILFGVMARKELGRFPERALRASREVILVPLKEKGAAGRNELVRRFPSRSPGRGLARVRVTRGMEDAIGKALRLLEPDDTLLILGSHITVEKAVGCM
jgi:dihydrofolate synthase/folylpolyglutamate synthase